MKHWKKIVFLFSGLVILYLAGCWYMARLLTNSDNSTIIYAEQLPGEKIMDWQLTAADGQKISAWYIRKDSEKAVILLAGKGGNRISMLGRAKIYLQNGYSVVLPDLRGTGNSTADFVTLGYKERYDLLACVDTLYALGYSKIGAHGHSLGAATICYSLNEFGDYSFVVLESCYDNIDHAFKHRMKRIRFPLWLACPVKKFAGMRMDVHAADLYPEKNVEKLRAPVLFLCGDDEWQIPVEETRELYRKCGSKEKYMHVFKKAQHEDFLRFDKEAFTAQLNKVMR